MIYYKSREFPSYLLFVFTAVLSIFVVIAHIYLCIIVFFRFVSFVRCCSLHRRFSPISHRHFSFPSFSRNALSPIFVHKIYSIRWLHSIEIIGLFRMCFQFHSLTLNVSVYINVGCFSFLFLLFCYFGVLLFLQFHLLLLLFVRFYLVCNFSDCIL